MSKAQIQVTFNWFYILIAGAVILLFFVGIVFKQKAISEERLNVEIVRIMESIFKGAGVSESTKNFIDTSGLADATFTFTCIDAVSTYGIKDTSATIEDSSTPLFSPSQLQTPQMILWSLPLELPYKGANLLFITAPKVRYIITGSDPTFLADFMNATAPTSQKLRIDREVLQDLSEVNVTRAQKLRIVDLDGSQVQQGMPVPQAALSLEDNQVTAISFTAQGAIFYQKQENSWQRMHREASIPVISVGGDRDASKIAAIITDSPENYQCNMQKAFKRLKFVTQIYAGDSLDQGTPGGKAQSIIEFYQTNPDLRLTRSDCYSLIFENPQSSLLTKLAVHQNRVNLCLQDQGQCSNLMQSAQELSFINDQLEQFNCLTLY